MNLKIPALVSPVVLVGVLALTHPAHASPIKGNSPTQVEGRCGNKEGGVYFPPDKNGVYGCLNGDGSGIVCGGKGKYAKTCDSWGATPNVARPNTATKPTREDFDKHAGARQK
ncbi:MAG: hypothetical protein JSS95_07910 [Acidobacteria bacterium]|nr:hypothetical protein [Acidobacteriota bacterium]